MKDFEKNPIELGEAKMPNQYPEELEVVFDSWEIFPGHWDTSKGEIPSCLKDGNFILGMSLIIEIKQDILHRLLYFVTRPFGGMKMIHFIKSISPIPAIMYMKKEEIENDT